MSGVPQKDFLFSTKNRVSNRGIQEACSALCSQLPSPSLLDYIPHVTRASLSENSETFPLDLHNSAAMAHVLRFSTSGRCHSTDEILDQKFLLPLRTSSGCSRPVHQQRASRLQKGVRSSPYLCRRLSVPRSAVASGDLEQAMCKAPQLSLFFLR